MIPVPPSRYADLLPLLEAVHFNAHFARAVLKGRVRGTVHVDDPGRPQAAYILHPCGMSLLCGSSRPVPFTGALLDYMLDRAHLRRSAELAQAFPDAWHGVLAAGLGPRLLRRDDPARKGLDSAGVRKLGAGRVVEWSRLNFEFDSAAFQALREPPLPAGLRLERAGRDVFNPWPGSVLPCFFWDGAEEFDANGVAFAVFDGSRPLCVAFSAWMLDGVLEIGIETHADARMRGLAIVACAALVRHALSRGLEPVWSAHRENRASQILARRLGFTMTLQLPYYELPVSAG
jgi:RimJ/RimL family protein N-acetyltransferase